MPLIAFTQNTGSLETENKVLSFEEWREIVAELMECQRERELSEGKDLVINAHKESILNLEEQVLVEKDKLRISTTMNEYLKENEKILISDLKSERRKRKFSYGISSILGVALITVFILK